ncbi:MAG: hypothetical protein ACRYHA_16540 [Janthinobacterium lividum]
MPPPRPAHSIASLKQGIDNLLRSIPAVLALPPHGDGMLATWHFDAQRHSEKLDHATRKLYGSKPCGVPVSHFWRQRHATTGLQGDGHRLHSLLQHYHAAVADFSAQLASTRCALDDLDPQHLLAHYHAIIGHCITCTERLAACRSDIPNVKRRSCMRLILRVSFFVAGAVLASVFAPMTMLAPVAGLILSFWEYWRERNNSGWNSLDAAVKAFADEVFTVERIVQARSAGVAEAQLQALERREARCASRIGEIAIAEIRNMALIDSLGQSVRRIGGIITDLQDRADGAAVCRTQDGLHAALAPPRCLRDASRAGGRWLDARWLDAQWRDAPWHDATWRDADGPRRAGFGTVRTDTARAAALRSATRRRHLSLPEHARLQVAPPDAAPRRAWQPMLGWHPAATSAGDWPGGARAMAHPATPVAPPPGARP